MPHDNSLDLPLLSPSDRNLFDTEFSVVIRFSLLPVIGQWLALEQMMSCSWMLVSACSSNALLAWEDVNTVK
jgi:hypothetical protein